MHIRPGGCLADKAFTAMRVVAAALAVGLFLAGSVSTVLGQSALGDVARQEAERRKAIKEESRVYTNQDLPAVPSRAVDDAPATDPAPVTDSAPEATDVADVTPVTSDDNDPADSASSAVNDEAPRDRAYWNARMASLRDTLSRDEVLAEALQSRVNALTTDFVNRDDPLQRAALAADRDRAVAELERLRKQLIVDEEAISDFQTEARRANVPPGWLR